MSLAALAHASDPDPDATDPLGERILDAALEQFRLVGIRRASIDDVARRARAGRVTVFRRFGSKDGLVHALVLREARRVLELAEAAMETDAPLEEQIVESFRVCLQAARRHPLLQGLLAAEPETVLPLLSTDGDEAVALGRVLLAGHLRAHGLLDDPDQTAEVVTRIGLSLLLSPRGTLRLDDDQQVRAFARRFLVPLLRAL